MRPVLLSRRSERIGDGSRVQLYARPHAFTTSLSHTHTHTLSLSLSLSLTLSLSSPAHAAAAALPSRSYGGEKHFDITYAGVEDRLGDAERRDRDRKERLLIVRSTPLLRDAVLAIGYKSAAAPGTAGSSVSSSVGMSRTQMRPFGRRNWSMAEDEMTAWRMRSMSK